MAKDKKSFLLYADIIYTIEHLTNEEKGLLFQHLLEYVNDKKPVLEDRILLIAWKPIERQLKRDLQKYEGTKEERRRSGQLGNLKKYNLDLYERVKSDELTLEDALAIAESRKASHSDAKLAVNDNVTVNDTDNVTVNDNLLLLREKFIKNNDFKDECLKSDYWIETIEKQNGLYKGTVELFLKHFEGHLITMDEVKKNLKDFKQHFVYWLKKQDLSHHKEKITGKTNQI